jgi:hypothetical protein
MIYNGFDNNHIPHSDLAQALLTSWIDILCLTLLRINPLTQCLMSMHNLQHLYPHSDATLIIEDSGLQEIAAIICYNNTTQCDVQPRSLIITTRNATTQWIPTVSHL